MKLEITRTILILAWSTPFLCSLAVAQQNAGSGTLSLSSIVQAMERAQSEARPQTP
jgi:hypothetical protein